MKIATLLPHKVLENEEVIVKEITAVAEEQPLYDLELVHKMSRGNEAFIKRTKQLFVETVPASVVDMQEGCETQDWSRVSAAAHKLKSTIDTMRIDSLRDVVRQIESAAKTGNNQSEIKNNVLHLADVIDKVINNLKEELN